jgi:hypothetical protein
VADQRRLAGARLAGEEDVLAAAEQVERRGELVGEDEAGLVQRGLSEIACTRLR